jgi:hypothetical protein
MLIESTSQSSHRHSADPLIHSESDKMKDSNGLSLHDLAIRICIEALAGGTDHSQPSQAIYDHIARGNTLVLTLGGAPIWASRHDATLPQEIFSSSPQDVAGGIYARHITHEQSLYYLLATRLTWVGADELCLYSVADSETSHDDIAFERLTYLANEIRSIVKSISGHSASLREHLSSNQPSLFVTCDSGTVVTASPVFLRLWQPDATPIGMRFSELMAIWSRGSKVRWTTRMIHLPGNDAPVTVVTFVSRDARVEQEIEPSAFLFHKLRNKLAGMVTASSYLYSDTGSLTPDEHESIKIIATSADQFEHTLSQLEVLTTPARDSRQSVSIASILSAASERITSVSSQSQVTISETVSGDVATPPVELTALCEAVLLSHGHTHSTWRSTVIDGSTHNGQLSVVFRTTIADPRESTRASQVWHSYANSVAEKLGIAIAHERRNGGAMHITSLEINSVTR